MRNTRWIGAAVLPLLLAECETDDETGLRLATGPADAPVPPAAFDSADAFARHLGVLRARVGGGGFTGDDDDEPVAARPLAEPFGLA